MTKRELITVIVPVYKVEKYLNKCVDSIINQTYKNLEIILVDDGSPDNCPKICDEYEKKDNRVKVIHKTNGGLSSARNAGLDIARGDYICFVDSDDWAELNMVEVLYNKIKEYNCDISVGGNNFFIGDKCFKVSDYKKIPNFTEADECYKLFYSKHNISFAAWGKLFEKRIFEKLRFPNGLNYEDAYIIFDLLSNIKVGICVSNVVIYNFLRKRDQSITTAVNEKSLDLIIAKRHIVEKSNMFNKKMFKGACSNLFSSYAVLYKRVIGNSVLINKLIKMFDDDYKKYTKYLSVKQKIKFFIFKHFKLLYTLIWIKLRK